MVTSTSFAAANSLSLHLADCDAWARCGAGAQYNYKAVCLNNYSGNTLSKQFASQFGSQFYGASRFEDLMAFTVSCC